LGANVFVLKQFRIPALALASVRCRLGVAVVMAAGGFTAGCSTVNGPLPPQARQAVLTADGPVIIRAQSGDSPVPPASTESTASAPSTLSTNPAGAFVENPVGIEAGSAADGPAQPTVSPTVVTGPIDTILESLFGEAATSSWTPLYFSEILTQGWNQPFVFSPPSESGALRQEWLNASNGVFYRQWTLGYNYRASVPLSGSADIGSWSIFAPLSRRLELFVTVPYADYRRVANPTPATDPGNPTIRSAAASSPTSYRTTFGDVTITPQVLLHETQNTSIMSILAVRTPTGSTAAGNGGTSLGPQVQFWQGLPKRWVIRGGAGATIPVTAAGLRTTIDTNLTVGKFLTLDEVRYFKEFTVWLALNNSATTDNRGPAADTLTILPGIRFRIVPNTWLLFGVETPLVTPRDEAFGMYFTFVRRW
jgi:hypothetical protein